MLMPKEPLYLKLYNEIKTAIVSGNLRGGERLPSKRCQADTHNVSTVTVQTAYEQLIAEGYITSRPRSGYFVLLPEERARQFSNQIITPNHFPVDAPNFPPVPPDFVPSCPSAYIDISNHTPHTDSFPFSTWSKLMREIISINYYRLLERLPHSGLFTLRQSIAKYLLRNQGVTVNPEYIVIGAGTEYLYSIAVKLVGRHSIIALENPGYRRLANIYAGENVTTTTIPLDGEGILPEYLALSKANVLHISPSGQFPTGCLMSERRRQAVLGWLQADRNRYVIEDDYEREFQFNKSHLPALRQMDYNNRTIYINTFSQTISPSLRISYMVLPSSLIQKYNLLYSNYSCTVTSFEQYTLAAFIDGGYFERHVNRLRRRYRQFYQTVLPRLSEFDYLNQLPRNIPGLNFLLPLKSSKDETELKRNGEEHGLKLNFLSDYLLAPVKVPPKVAVLSCRSLNLASFTAGLEILKVIL